MAWCQTTHGSVLVCGLGVGDRWFRGQEQSCDAKPEQFCITLFILHKGDPFLSNSTSKSVSLFYSCLNSRVRKMNVPFPQWRNNPAENILQEIKFSIISCQHWPILWTDCKILLAKMFHRCASFIGTALFVLSWYQSPFNVLSSWEGAKSLTSSCSNHSVTERKLVSVGTIRDRGLSDWKRDASLKQLQNL